jgi:pimeloyl-ACP methyl ester carboxylesterase
MPVSNRTVFGCVVLAVALASAGEAAGQTDPKKKVPEPEDVTIETKDKVTLVATYYSTKTGKEAVPIIMLHGWGGSRGEYHNLALEMQKRGHTVLVPDLRGHGQSTKQAGAPINLNDVLRKLELLGEDVEACKRFLLDEHRAQNLNINRLVVVAAEESCVLAINYAAQDWLYPPIGGIKQGEDVRAVVLLSPQWQHKTLNIAKAVNGSTAVQKFVWFYFIVGDKDGGAMGEFNRVSGAVKRHRPDSQIPPREKDLFMLPIGSMAQGTKLLTLQTDLDKQIAKFVELSVVNNRDLDWKDRPKRD